MFDFEIVDHLDDLIVEQLIAFYSVNDREDGNGGNQTAEVEVVFSVIAEQALIAFPG